MNNNANALKDTRLLEALEFIDDSYVADVFACIKAPDVTAAPAGGKGKILRSLKYVAAVAACALLMSTLIPVVQYVSGNLNSFLPSGLLGSTEEYDPPYWEYTPELEPLSKETIENINRLFFISQFGLTPEEFLAESENKDEAQELIDNTRLIKKHSNYIYYGTFGDSVVASHSIDLMEGTTYTFDGLKLEYSIKTTVYVYNKGTLYTIDTAYEKGLLTYKNIELILERYQKYLNGHQ